MPSKLLNKVLDEIFFQFLSDGHQNFFGWYFGYLRCSRQLLWPSTPIRPICEILKNNLLKKMHFLAFCGKNWDSWKILVCVLNKSSQRWTRVSKGVKIILESVRMIVGPCWYALSISKIFFGRRKISIQSRLHLQNRGSAPHSAKRFWRRSRLWIEIFRSPKIFLNFFKSFSKVFYLI